MACILSTRFTMKADVLRQTDTNNASIDINDVGEWKARQDPETLEIIREWVPITNDDPSTPDAIEPFSIDCLVRSAVSYSGARVGTGTGENYGQEFSNVEFARMSFPTSFILTTRDRITNVRSAVNGVVIWRDEEQEHGEVKSTVFDITGVVPVMDPFNNHIENMAILQRAEVQA